MMNDIKIAEQLIDTTSFDNFCNSINEGFQSLLFLVEIQKTGNEDLSSILKEVEYVR